MPRSKHKNKCNTLYRLKSGHRYFINCSVNKNGQYKSTNIWIQFNNLSIVASYILDHCF